MMAVLPEFIYRFFTISVKIQVRVFIEINKLILKFMWKSKGTRIAKTVLKKKNKVKGITLPDLKTYVATAIMSV